MPFLPYTLHGYIGFSGCGAPSPWKEKMKHSEEDTQSQEAPSVHNCRHTPTPSCHTAHVSPVRFTLTHGFTSVPQPVLSFSRRALTTDILVHTHQAVKS